jgi:S1-C subfamily serine protease
MATSLAKVSEELASLVEKGAPSVVRVEGRRRSSASGVVWSADGVIVTAHHSVDADEEVPVGLHDGGTTRARVVGRDPGSDLAVLRAEASGLVPVRWGDAATPRPGELVVALSRPGRTIRARLGVVSAVAGEWRTPIGGRLETYLETDVAPHPGFSGGLLVAADGSALGVNNAGILRGTPLALGPATAKRVVGTLLERGRMRRGWLGIGTQVVALTPDVRETAGQEAALLVLSVQPGGPAAKAGLFLGDVLLHAGDETLTSPQALLSALEEESVGRELALRVLRGGEVRSVSVTVGEREAA